jgi:hypothetical protein
VLGVDGELLAQRELDEGLLLPGSEESDDALEDRNRESRCTRHRAPDSARVGSAKGD